MRFLLLELAVHCLSLVMERADTETPTGGGGVSEQGKWGLLRGLEGGRRGEFLLFYDTAREILQPLILEVHVLHGILWRKGSRKLDSFYPQGFRLSCLYTPKSRTRKRFLCCMNLLTRKSRLVSDHAPLAPHPPSPLFQVPCLHLSQSESESCGTERVQVARPGELQCTPPLVPSALRYGHPSPRPGPTSACRRWFERGKRFGPFLTRECPCFSVRNTAEFCFPRPRQQGARTTVSVTPPPPASLSVKHADYCSRYKSNGARNSSLSPARAECSRASVGAQHLEKPCALGLRALGSDDGPASEQDGPASEQDGPASE
eukprot:2383207-Rhodomonas_salina.2